MSEQVETQEVLVFLSEGAADLRIARATVKFAKTLPREFAILAAFHSRTAFGADVENYIARWKSQLRGLISVLGIAGTRAEELLEGFVQGEFSELKRDAGSRYADAVLKLDEYLVKHGYQKRDGRPSIAWDVVE